MLKKSSIFFIFFILSVLFNRVIYPEPEGTAISEPNIPGTNNSSYQEAFQLASRGKHQEAAQKYEEILKTEPRNFQARYELARIYLETGRYEEAEKILGFFATLTDDDIAGFNPPQFLSFARGLWLYATRTGEKDLFHAVVSAILPKIEQMDKNNPEPEGTVLSELYLFWGRCYLEKGDLPEA
ncbi:MAG: tetratricopeptide repeat protein, partial [Planctomycetota bacterium]